jgi:ribosomal-protein-alanine N-acetyltransferase
VIGFLQRNLAQGSDRRSVRVPDLRTGPLRLVAITPDMLAAEHQSDAQELGRLLEAKLTVGWPPVEWEPHVYRIIQKQYDEWPESFGWHRYVLLEGGFGRQGTLVGAVGGFPRRGGDVEIGYSTLPEFQRRGFATAFATRLVNFLLEQNGVASVSAQAYPQVQESIKVMQRCGMSYVGEGDEAGTVRYRRMKMADA